MSIRVLTALPVYNEAHHLRAVLPAVQHYSQEILVVDDGSSDATPERLREFADVRVIRHELNLGYGAALSTAFAYAVAHRYDVLVTIDCDGQHEPKLIPAMAAAVFPPDEEPWDIISGSRYLQQFPGQSEPPVQRRQINLEITAQLNRLFDLGLTDSFCGFKAYRVDALPRLHITEFGYAMPLQLWVQAVAQKMRIQEFPVPLIYLDEKRTFGTVLDDADRRRAYYQHVLWKEIDAQRPADCEPCCGIR